MQLVLFGLLMQDLQTVQDHAPSSSEEVSFAGAGRFIYLLSKFFLVRICAIQMHVERFPH